jgi:glucose/arabinose dehydrogenase
MRLPTVRTDRLFAVTLLALTGTLTAAAAAPRDPVKLTVELCAGCHGPNLVGGPAPSLLDDVWKYGGDDASILRAIRDGFPQANMPPFSATLSEDEQRAMLGHIRKLSRQYALGLIPAIAPAPPSVSLQSEKHNFRLETFAAPLDTPWGIVFLPDGRMLVSDRVGFLRVIEKDGTLRPEPIRGTPQPFVRQDGGLLDVIAHPDYAKNGWLYLAYTEAGMAPNTTMTVVVRGKIRDGAWVEQQDIFRANQKYYYVDYSHYGCRFLFDREAHLFFTIGDRGKPPGAQDLSSPCGKIHRVFDDGRIPPDNPFANRPNACGSIWSFGNRHVQGLQFHPVTGRLWATEHGPRGGDELNRIERGHNYGWPVISYGLPQIGERIDGTAREGMEQPAAWWTPSIAPAAIEFYTGNRFPEWKNNLFIACLVGRQLRRIEVEGDKVIRQEVIFSEMGRVRDVVTGPDGFIYVALNNPGRIARLVPEDAVTSGR